MKFQINKLNKDTIFYLVFLILFFVFFIIKNSFSLNEKFYKTSSEMKHRNRKNRMRPFVRDLFKGKVLSYCETRSPPICQEMREVVRQYGLELENQDLECGNLKMCKDAESARNRIKNNDTPIRFRNNNDYYKLWIMLLDEVYPEIKQEYATLLNYQDNLPDNEEEAFKKIVDGINKQKPIYIKMMDDEIALLDSKEKQKDSKDKEIDDISDKMTIIDIEITAMNDDNPDKAPKELEKSKLIEQKKGLLNEKELIKNEMKDIRKKLKKIKNNCELLGANCPEIPEDETEDETEEEPEEETQDVITTIPIRRKRAKYQSGGRRFERSSGLGKGPIAGIVAGSLFGLAGIIYIIDFLRKKYKKPKEVTYPKEWKFQEEQKRREKELAE